jgi:hypothetical protein
MSEEIVTTSKDDGFRNQWATGVFYRMDGKKWTVKSKSLLGFLAGFFLFCLVAVLFSDSGSIEESHVEPITTSETAESSQRYQFERFDALAGENKPEAESKPGPSRPAGPVEKFVGLARLDRIESLSIPPGTLAKAKLTSGASNGPVRATLTNNVSVDGDELLPAGALLVGIGSSTEDRLMIRFAHAVFSDGKAVKISAQACDGSDQTIGLKGSKVGNEALKLAAGIGLNFAGGVSEGLQESSVQGGVEVKKPTMKNALLNGASTASLEYARQTMSELRSRQPVIEVPNGTEICVLFQGGEDG